MFPQRRSGNKEREGWTGAGGRRRGTSVPEGPAGGARRDTWVGLLSYCQGGCEHQPLFHGALSNLRRWLWGVRCVLGWRGQQMTSPIAMTTGGRFQPGEGCLGFSPRWSRSGRACGEASDAQGAGHALRSRILDAALFLFPELEK